MLSFKKIVKKLIHQYLRMGLLGLRVKYLNYFYGMNIHPTARISLKSKLDYTNPKGVNIGAGSYLAFGVVILAHDMSRLTHMDVNIGKNCFIGCNSIIMPGVTIGDSVVVGSGSVVTKSFKGNCVIAGNPAKVIKEDIYTKELGIFCEAG
ncbi:acyltransferase [Bacterioplanoides sp.]|uniref:acyltransferase n=1 Tax=Bacterioplanoides sp. TaxID=2066072 RepID=UPI003B0095EF